MRRVMRHTGLTSGQSVLRVTGSLWFASVILVLLLLTMACATVYESTHGSERALATFYRAWWFEGLLALLGINILAAVAVRLPIRVRQLGFVLTHISILAILLGSLVTKYFGVEGRLGLAEGESTGYFAIPQETLTLVNRERGTESSVDLQQWIGDGFHALHDPGGKVLALDDVRVVVERYLPDSKYVDRVEQVSDGSAHAFPAVEVSLSQYGRADPQWLFLNRAKPLGATTAIFRMLDEEELTRLVSAKSSSQPHSGGTVRVEYEGTTYEYPVEECTDQPLPLGSTGLTIRVLQSFTHATVTPDNQVVNASPNPVNPAIQVEIARGTTVETRFAFAKFPSFRADHGSESLSGLNVVYTLPKTTAPQAPIEVLGGPNGDLYVRFAWEGTHPVTKKAVIGEPIETPWPGKKFSVLRMFERARVVRELTEVVPIRKNRVPAVRVRATTPQGTRELWVQRRVPAKFSIGGDATYELSFGDKLLPLGFRVTLNRFHIGHYPGTRRPRSFESHISILDAASGRTGSRVISMNHPAGYGGYTFYQSSYSIDGGTRISYLSVARDPGQPIVFIGYMGTLVGMLVVLATRLAGQRRPYVRAPAAKVAAPGTPRSVSLIDGTSRCEQNRFAKAKEDGNREEAPAGAVRMRHGAG